MGFANVLQNGVPCFVRHMAEKIFLLYLSGFQDFQIAVCGGFGMGFQYHSPHSGQSGVHIVKAHGRHPIHINFRVCQQLRKFVMGDDLTQQPVIDPPAFQEGHRFIRQVQLRKGRVFMRSVVGQTQQVVHRHLIKSGQF